MSKASNLIQFMETKYREKALKMVARLEKNSGKKFSEKEKEDLIQKFSSNMINMNAGAFKKYMEEFEKGIK